MSNRLKIFGDGSALGNPGPGGWGAILKYGNDIRKISGGSKYTTNNQMELTAIIMALKDVNFACDIEIYSDSQYVCKGINEWLHGWVKKNWKGSAGPVKNVDLWKEYLDVAKGHSITCIWVKGHAGHPENEECDKMAVNEANKYKTMVG